MRDLAVFLQDLDLSHYGAQFAQLVAHADPWLLGIAVSALVGLGHKMAVGNRLVYGWGLRLAALAFLIQAGIALVQAGGLDALPVSSALGRSALVGGGVLATIWILLPIVLFVYTNFRFGLAGFAGYFVYAVVTTAAISSEAMPGIALRGGLVAGLAMVLAWIFRPIWEFIASLWLTRSAARQTEKATDKVDDPRLSRRERRLLRLARLRARKAELAATADGPQDQESRRRRDKARLDAELAYLLAAPHLAGSFPREMFDAWVQRYLGNRLPPEEVEENSWQVQKAFRNYHNQAEGGSLFNLEELHFWFVDEQRRIQEQTLEAPLRQEKLLALQELYISLSQRFLGDPPAAIVQMVSRRPKELAVPQPRVAEAVAGM